MNDPAAARALLETLFRAGLDAVHAHVCVEGALSRDGHRLRIDGREVADGAQLVVVSVGKAAAAMAEALESVAADRVRRGLVITKDGHAEGARLTRFRILEAAHPVPDERSEAAALEVRSLVEQMNPDDVLVVLLSGGGSALLSAPVPGISAREFAETQRRLLESGADIEELNTVRKHLSLLSGGRLAQAARARSIEVLAISDVPGDDESVIASGPCSADPSCFGDAVKILERRGVSERIPEPIIRYLREGASGGHQETLKPGDPLLDRVRYCIVARNRTAVEAAAACARAQGFEVVRVLDGALTGEARDIGLELLKRAHSLPGDRPCCLIAGGETTVKVEGRGRGGRNQELALAAAIALNDLPAQAAPITLLCAGTDGSDGPTRAAGAFADARSVTRGRERNVSAEACLAENDSHRFFEAEGGLLVTGPTGTNVMDLLLIAVGPPPRAPAGL